MPRDNGLNRPHRPRELHPLDRFDLDDDNDEPATPPYRRNMSQLTLPPEYFSETNEDTSSAAHRAGASDEKPQTSSQSSPIGSDERDAKRRDSGERDAIYGQNNNSSPSSSRPEPGVYEGETLVGRRPAKNVGDLSQTVHYPDEHGGLLHAMPSPGYPDPRIPKPHDNIRTFSTQSSGLQSLANTDDENSDVDETYDWSDEDDLVDEEAKFENKISSTKKKTWGARRIATFFVSTLIGSVLISALLAAVPILVLFLYYKPHKTEHRRWVADNISAWFFWIAANHLISWFLAVLINILPHVVTWFVGVTWGTVSESFKSRIALYDAFKGWIKPIFYAASLWVSYVIIFSNIYGLHNTQDGVQSHAEYTDRLYQVVEFIFFLVLVVSLEKILIQITAFTFHRVAFEERVNDVAFAVKVLDKLKDYRPKRRTHGQNRSSVAGIGNGRKTPPLRTFGLPPSRKNSDGNDYPQSRRPTTLDPVALEEGFADAEDFSGPTLTKKGKGRKSWFGGRRSPPTGTPAESLPMSPARRNMADESFSTPSRSVSRDLDAVVEHTYPPTSPDRRSVDTHSSDDGAVMASAAKALKNAVLHDARNIKGKEGGAADLSFSVTSPHEAKKLARDLYLAFRADRRRSHLIPSDFYPAYPNPEEAKEAFKIFDKDGNENITRAEIKTTIMKIYKERRFLARSLRDVGAAVATLDSIMLFFALVIIFFISLSVFNVSIGKSLTSVYSLGIAASFIFKNAASNAFDAIMFLFVTHPFDSGDRCFIDNENLIVKKMGLFATTFTRSDGTQTYYFNSQLFVKFITNVRRSGKTFENLTMQVNWRTPIEKLDALEQHLNHWMEKDENRWFNGPTSIMLQKIDYQRSLELTVGIPHNGNWQDWGARNNRKTVFHAATNYYCNQLGIVWANSPQQVLLTEPNSMVPPLLSSQDLDGPTGGDDQMSLDSPALVPKATAPPKPALFFVPPPEDLTGLRQRKTKKNKAVRGNFDG